MNSQASGRKKEQTLKNTFVKRIKHLCENNCSIENFKLMPTIQSQTFNILKGLKKKEWQELKYYFASPFFFNPKSKAPVLPKLVDILCEYYEEQVKENPENPTYDYIVEKLYNGKKTTNKKITNLLSRLEEHLNTFFRHSYIKQQNSLLNDVFVLKQLNKRVDEVESSRPYFKRKLKKIEGNFKQFSEQSSEYWYKSYLLEIEKGSFFKWEDNFERDKYIKEGVKNLDFFYLLEKLKYMSLLCDMNKLTDKKIGDLRLEEFLKYFESIKSIIWEELPIFRMYYYLLKGLLDHEEAEGYYEKLQKELIEHGLKISNRERQNLRIAIVNFYVRNRNINAPYYQKKLYHFYQQLLKGKLILVQGKLSYGDYRNLTIMGIEQKDWKWVENFIDMYSEQITPASREKDTHAYCLAMLSFNQPTPDYEKSISYLADIKTNYVFFTLWRRTLLIRCYYEIGKKYSDILEAQLKSFKQYIYKQGMNERSMGYRHFVRLLKRIVEITVFDKTQKNYTALQQEIKETYPLIHREWLLEKLEAKAPSSKTSMMQTTKRQ